MPIIKAKIELDSIVYSDAFGTYDVLDVLASITIASTAGEVLVFAMMTRQ